MDRATFLHGVVALAASNANRARSSGTMRVGVPIFHRGIDPYLDAYSDVADLSWISGEGLVRITPSGTSAWVANVPMLGSRRISYRIRSGVRWHDGRNVVGSDIVAAYRRLMQNTTFRNLAPYNAVTKIDVTGVDTFDVFLGDASRDAVAGFFAPYGALAVPLLRSDGRNTVGTGAFALTERSAEHVHYRRIRGVGMGGIEIRFFDDSAAALTSLLAREIDGVVPIDRTVVPVTSGYSTYRRRFGTVYLVANQRGPLNSRERASILSLLDVDLIAKKIYRTRSTNELLPGVAVEPVASIKRAVETIRIACASTPVQRNVAALISQELSATGIASEIRQWPLQAYEVALRQGNYDFAIWGGEYASLNDAEPEFVCGNRAPRGPNIARLCDPALDRAFALRDAAGAGKRLSDDAVLRVLAPYEDVAMFRNGMSLPLPRLAHVPWFADVERWSIS